ncbi:MAG: DUF2125 domain-containing protein [Rhodobacteraceae bacterium]|nr:MAG: DUF2125 domain-containing protein [Paracoccaceae bacterium]
MMPRRVIAALFVLAALWSGWWLFGATAHDRALNGWLAERRAEGWQAEAADLTTAGFPTRFDTRLTDLRLADPERGWAWAAPTFDILMQAWAPNAALVVLPPEQTLAVPGARATLRSERMEGAVRFVPGPSLALDALSAEIAGLTVDATVLGGGASPGGWTAEAAVLEARLARAAPGSAPDHGYDLSLTAADVILPAPILAAIDPSGALPETFDSLVIDVRAGLDRPLDRRTAEAVTPGVTALSLRRVEARWGALELTATGRLRADAQGYAEGELRLRAVNWREILRAAVAAGALRREVAGALEAGLGLVAALSGDRDTIEAPLAFSNGNARIGPVPVGRAPRLRDPSGS